PAPQYMTASHRRSCCPLCPVCQLLSGQGGWVSAVSTSGCIEFTPEIDPFNRCIAILPCFASTLARWSNPISDARSPCQYVTRKIVLSHLKWIPLTTLANGRREHGQKRLAQLYDKRAEEL